jgi:hypothetical protein
LPPEPTPHQTAPAGGQPLPPPLPSAGWREWLSLPDLGIPGIKAKVDSGARTSALHTHDYEVYTDPGSGLARVRFHIHPVRRRRQVLLTCDAPVADFREVRDSGGHSERRPFVRTTAAAGVHAWAIDLSLTNREGMKFRMLLGREALAGRFTIDPARSYLLGPKLSRVYR